MTDEQYDEIIERAKPDLRKALRAVMESGGNARMVHLFEIGRIPLANGERWNITCVMLSEPAAGLFEGMLEGIRRMEKAYQKLLPPGTKVPSWFQ